MIEYPKVIHLSGGLDVTVTSAADEARWMASEPVTPPEPVPFPPEHQPESEPEPKPEPEAEPEPEEKSEPKKKPAHTHAAVGAKKK